MRGGVPGGSCRQISHDDIRVTVTETSRPWVGFPGTWNGCPEENGRRFQRFRDGKCLPGRVGGFPLSGEDQLSSTTCIGSTGDFWISGPSAVDCSEKVVGGAAARQETGEGTQRNDECGEKNPDESSTEDDLRRRDAADEQEKSVLPTQQYAHHVTIGIPVL